jgi:hypothetical protein
MTKLSAVFSPDFVRQFSALFGLMEILEADYVA